MNAAKGAVPGADGWIKPAAQMPGINDKISLRIGSDPYPEAHDAFTLHRYVALYGFPERITWRPLSSSKGGQ